MRKSNKLTKPIAKYTSTTGGEKRSRDKELIPTLTLGKIPSKYISSVKFATDKNLNNFVDNEIKYGPQIVSIPVPPQRHAFLVDIDCKKRKIMISDWGSEQNKCLGIEYLNNNIKNSKFKPEWKQYSDLMTKLENRFKWPIEYYPVDKELEEISDIHNDTCGGGGCSNYIYAWVEKHYPDYSS